jgi:hypothetical protein
MRFPTAYTPFQSATTVLPLISETFALEQTVEIVFRDARSRIRELLIVFCERTTPESMAVVEKLR